MGQFTDVTWPLEYTELTRIEELLHCRICYEYIQTSVITPCSHNYCSICIRKFLQHKSECPICFKNIYEKDLYTNRILDEIMKCYLSIRDKLILCIKGTKVKEAANHNQKLSNIGQSPLKKGISPRLSQNKNTPQKLAREKSSEDLNRFQGTSSKESIANTQIFKTPNKNSSGPSTIKTTPKSACPLFRSGSTEKVKTEDDKKRVPCPVCDIRLLPFNINRHLDDCLKRQNSTTPPKVTNNNLPPIPKYVLNLMKDAQLKKILKEWGLATNGGRKVLEKRLQKFTTIYSAERDKLEPRSIETLVKLCEEEELAEKNAQKLGTSDYMQNIKRNADPKIIEKAQKDYLEKNRDEFQKLVQSVSDREKSSTTNISTPSSNVKVEDDDVPSTSSVNQLSNCSFSSQSGDQEGPSSSFNNLSAYCMQDSDSANSTCPLQYYSDNHAIKFLSMEVSSSDNQQSPIKSVKEESTNSLEMTAVKNSGVLEGSEKSLQELTPSNPSTSRTSFSHNSGGSLRVRHIAELMESKSDIFDLSTEDNWSDSNSNISIPNKPKKLVMKRAKVRRGIASSDSDTDVESNFKFTGRKPKKLPKHRDRVSSEDPDNGKTQELISNCDEASNQDKENTEVQIPVPVIDQPQTRRSTRKRKSVSYSSSLKKSETKKILLEETANTIKIKTEAKPITETIEEEKKSEGNDKPKRKLRERRP